ncbi:MAG: hypothetical protein AUK55_09185 [Syntrophobacteraceae bacterium CG2_30_61_12]|nr:MAG: hypothetical protein AUK55_09185 [Syntrophobacteraceae bacterium CG2_30_61_12]PIU32486.1 MAG: hypothetical protein COT06_02495 [Syntrophobacteraceae bacterium CG07_land_8_20_14_0_80_61_8]
MAGLEELEKSIANLPDEEYGQFRRWFLERDWERRDRQIAEDARAGKLDFLVKEALDAKKEKKLRELRVTERQNAAGGAIVAWPWRFGSSRTKTST